MGNVYKALRIVPCRNKGTTSAGGYRKKGGGGGGGGSTWHVVSAPLSISEGSFYLNLSIIVETVPYILEN